MQFRFFVRASLWLLLPLAALVSIEAFTIGLFFAPALFVSDRPFAVVTWFGLVVLPLAIFLTLFLTRRRRVGYSREGAYRRLKSGWLYTPAAMIWAFMFFMLFVVWWHPSANGGPWGW